MSGRVPIGFLLRRLALAGVTSFIVSSVVFLGVHQLPGNAFLGGRKLDEGAIAALLHRYGLDLPLLEQYRQFVARLTSGDLGESLVNQGVHVTPLLLREAIVSAEIGVVAICIAVFLGVPLGMAAARRVGTKMDWLISGITSLAYGLPSFVIASLLVLVLAVWMYDATGGRIFYELGWSGTYGNPAQVVVPAIALGLPYAGLLARLTRASALDVMREDYVRTARAKGLGENRVIYRHVLRNALFPVITILGPLSLAILTGSVVVETIFGVPGLGKEFVTSILTRDYNIVIGLFTVYAILISLVNLVVDVLYAALDPRVSYG